ncbi:MAG: 50S ribosomal protein L23 [Eubacterium sp.]|nr:50S ribosomal protein L23 [Eubacterium sp.]
MADLKYYDIISKPVITEKSMSGMEFQKYTFYVHTEATKTQIKEAVEKMFPGTKVAKVNTMNVDGKKRRRGMVVGKTAKRKKAIVTLAEGEIEIFEGL